MPCVIEFTLDKHNLINIWSKYISFYAEHMHFE